MKRFHLICLGIFIIPATASAVDYEKSLPHDHNCVVEAFNGEGDIYLRCKGVKGTLKTTVETPVISEAFTNNVKESAKQGKRSAVAAANWSLLSWSFASQNQLLITFNENKTLIKLVTAYVGAGFKPGVSF